MRQTSERGTKEAADGGAGRSGRRGILADKAGLDESNSGRLGVDSVEETGG